MLDQVLSELLVQFSEPNIMFIPIPLLIAMAASGLIEGGLGIWKAVKGRKMEKQAISDRHMYINTMSDIYMHQLGQSTAMRDMVMGGVPGGSSMPTVGNLPYSSLQQGSEQVGSQLSGYLNTIGNIGSPSNTGIRTFEDKAMEKKKMAQKLKVKKQTTPRSFGRRSFGGKRESGTRSSMYL
jgi:hypothetical protein